MARGQLVQFGFHSGIDEKTDPKQAQPGQLVELVNMRQNKSGRLDRRYGHTQLNDNTLGGTDEIISCYRLMTSKSELLVAGDLFVDASGPKLLGYSSKLAQWKSHAPITRAMPRWSVVQQSSGDFNDIQVAVGNGFTVFSWTQPTPGGATGDAYAMVQDTASGTVVLAATMISNGAGNASLPRLAVCGTIAVLMWSDTAGKLVASLLDLTAPGSGWGSRVDVKTDQNTLTNFYDIVETTGNAFVGVYSDTTATPLMKAFRCTVTLPATITVTHTVNSGDTNGLYTSICLAYDSTNAKVWCLYGASTPYPVPATFHVKGYVMAAATCAVSVAPFTTVSPTSQIIQSGLTWVNGSNVRGFYQTANGDGKCVELAANVTLGNVPTMLLSSRPFNDGTTAYAVFRYQQSLFLCVIGGSAGAAPNPLRPVATIAPRIAYPLASVSGSGAGSLDQAPTRVWNVAGKHWRTYGTVIADSNVSSRVVMTALDLQLDDAWLANGDAFPAQHFEPVEFGELLHLSGGLPQSFDGQQLSEMGFLHAPDANQLVLTPANVGGGLGQGTYQYRICYEWTDNRGQVYRSPPSTAKSVTTTGAGTVNKVTLTVPNLLLTTKTNVQIIVYRTVVNGDGSIFYRQTAYAVPLGNINDSAQATTSIIDTTGDVTIQAQGLLYTNGGTLDAQCPSALGCLIKHQRRLAGVGDDGRTVWMSNEFVDREAPRWNEEWQFQFDDPINALATLDDKLIALSETQIWFINGQGPTDTGASNDWTAPQPVQTNTGCIDQRSIMYVAEGVMFQGRRGYYLLDRALNVTFVGALVEDTTKTSPLPVCALSGISSETSCFVSLKATPAASTGLRLHWDTFFRMWGKDLLTDDQGAPGVTVAGLVEWDGVVAWASSAGRVFIQSSSSWLDTGYWYDSSFISAVISSGGPLGFNRVRFAQVESTYLTPHDLRMSFAFDGSSSFVQSGALTPARTADTLKIRVGSQNGASPRCSGIQIKVEILTPTSGVIGTGQAAQLTGIGLEIVPKSGQKRIGATAQY